jgi:hypothetical protein
VATGDTGAAGAGTGSATATGASTGGSAAGGSTVTGSMTFCAFKMRSMRVRGRSEPTFFRPRSRAISSNSSRERAS